MMTKAEKEIATYLSNQTKGLLRVHWKMARRIVQIATEGAEYEGFVIKYKFNSVTGSYENYRVIKTTMEKITKVIEQVQTQFQGFYKYDLHNSEGNHFKTIYSLNANLFD